MTFAQLAQVQARLHKQVMQKEANLVGKAIGLPFRAAGYAAKKTVGTTARAVTAVPRAMARSTMIKHGPIKGSLMVGGTAVLGTGAAMSAVGKTRSYNRGFDPRIQDAAAQRVR